LVLYPLDKWLNFEEKIRQLPQFDPRVQQLKRVYVAGAIECTIDGNGRLLVPQSMREFAGLERDVVWVGQLDTMELWSSARWTAAMDEAMQDPQGLAEAMASLGL
jgi:MraZ protein